MLIITLILIFSAILSQSAARLSRSDTAHREGEEALRESEERYRLIFETANEGIWLTDAERKTLLVNQRMAQMLGYSTEEMIGKSPSAFLDPDQESVRLETRRLLAAGQKIQQEFKFRRKDGSVLWVISNASPMADSANRRVSTVSMLTDITERKQAEEKLAWLASFPGLNPNPIAELELASGEVKYVNPPAERLFPDLIRLGVAHPLLAGAREQATAAGPVANHWCARSRLATRGTSKP